MDYYTVADIMQITGFKRSYSYKLLSSLIEKFKEEYPDSIVLEARIPKWYFEKKMKNREGD
jgi:hypothetical protein